MGLLSTAETSCAPIVQSVGDAGETKCSGRGGVLAVGWASQFAWRSSRSPPRSHAIAACGVFSRAPGPSFVASRGSCFVCQAATPYAADEFAER